MCGCKQTKYLNRILKKLGVDNSAPSFYPKGEKGFNLEDIPFGESPDTIYPSVGKDSTGAIKTDTKERGKQGKVQKTYGNNLVSLTGSLGSTQDQKGKLFAGLPQVSNVNQIKSEKGKEIHSGITNLLSNPEQIHITETSEDIDNSKDIANFLLKNRASMERIEAPKNLKNAEKGVRRFQYKGKPYLWNEQTGQIMYQASFNDESGEKALYDAGNFIYEEKPLVRKPPLQMAEKRGEFGIHSQKGQSSVVDAKNISSGQNLNYNEFHGEKWDKRYVREHDVQKALNSDEFISFINSNSDKFTNNSFVDEKSKLEMTKILLRQFLGAEPTPSEIENSMPKFFGSGSNMLFNKVIDNLNSNVGEYKDIKTDKEFEENSKQRSKNLTTEQVKQLIPSLNKNQQIKYSKDPEKYLKSKGYNLRNNDAIVFGYSEKDKKYLFPKEFSRPIYGQKEEKSSVFDTPIEEVLKRKPNPNFKIKKEDLSTPNDENLLSGKPYKKLWNIKDIVIE